MKKLNKILASTMAVPALAAIAPVLTLTSCGGQHEVQHLTLPDDQRTQQVNGNIVFEVIFDCSFRIQNTDNFEVEVVNLQSTNDATVAFEYDETRSIIDEDGTKLVLKGILSKSDGGAIESGSTLSFDLNINYSNDERKATWTESFTDFNIAYSSLEPDITIVPGQDTIYTQPGSDIQCLKFQLNGTHVSEDTSTIGLEVTMTDHSDDVTGVSIIAPAIGHRVFDVDNDVLFVWVKLVRNGNNNDTESYAHFNVRLFCQERIAEQLVTLWDISFKEHTFMLKKGGEDQRAIVLPDERLDGGIGHDAGDTFKTYRLYYLKEFMGQTPEFQQLKKDGTINIKKIEFSEEHMLYDTYCYRDVTVSFDNCINDNDIIRFELSVHFASYWIPLENFTFTYISEKIKKDSVAGEDIKYKRFTEWSDNYKVFQTELWDPMDYSKLSRIQFSIVPAGKHTENVTIENRRRDVLVTKGETLLEWDPMLKNELGQPLNIKDYCEFDVIFTGYDANTKQPIWRQKFGNSDKHFRLTKQNDPATLKGDANQFIDPADDKKTAWYQFSLGSTISSTDFLNVQTKITGQSYGAHIKIGQPSIEFVEKSRDTIWVKLPMEATDGGEVVSGHFIEFNLTLSSDEDGYTWSKTFYQCRMEVWPGFNLHRGVEIEVTAKGDKQWFLTSGETGEHEIIPAHTEFGTTSTVTIDTNVWKKETATDFPADRTYVLYMPENPQKGMLNNYLFDNISITRTRNGENHKLEASEYKVSDSGPITIVKGVIQQGDIITYNLRLAPTEGKTKVTHDTRFYWTYR